jgi:hypothetical protein
MEAGLQWSEILAIDYAWVGRTGLEEDGMVE